MQIPETTQKRSERPVLLKPFHVAELFFTTEDADDHGGNQIRSIAQIYADSAFGLSVIPFEIAFPDIRRFVICCKSVIRVIRGRLFHGIFTGLRSVS